MAAAESMTISAEMEVVVAMSRAVPEQAELDRIGGRIAQLDWTYLLVLAKRHQVFARVWPNLLAHYSSSIPQPIREQEKNALRRHFVDCGLMVRQLFSLLDLFKEAKIPVIPYKGPVLAAYLYGDFSRRSYIDLDLLISSKDFPAVYELLLDHEFVPEITIRSGQLRFFRRAEDDLAFRSKQGVMVEVHWELSGRYLRKPLVLEAVQNDMQSVSLSGREVPVFTDENLLIYFALHGTKHCWQKLEHVSCVAELLLKARRLDWQYIWKMAKEYRCRGMISVAVLLAEDIYAVGVDKEVARIVRADTKVVRLSNMLSTTCCANRDERGEQRHRDPRFSLLRFTIRDSKADALRYLLRVIFIPSKAEWKDQALPDSLAWFYYILRPWKIVAAVGTQIKGHICRVLRVE